MTQITGPVRLRMAPGPTGPFHIGRTRTALLNWLFARHYGGTFVLRIEDTDVKRSSPVHLQGILDSMRWLGLEWDEGPDVGGPYAPYFQMGRLHTYREAADDLLKSGKAYPCYCTKEELDALREQARIEGRPFRYPGTCRNLSDAQRAAKEAEGIVPVLRLRMPDEGQTEFEDMLLGLIAIPNAELDDWIIMRGNDIPTYNFAVVVDDLTMDITHVLRGQEHISNTPRQLAVYRSLGRPHPEFGHFPMVLGKGGGKLSARYGAEAVTSYGDRGYLPEAIVNFLATLGASYSGEQEIFSLSELIEVFDIDRVGKSGAVFDEEKLDWMNGVWIRRLDTAEFVDRSLPFLQRRELLPTQPSDEQVAYAARALALEQERVRTLAETPEAVEFFLSDDIVYDPASLVPKKGTPEDTKRVLVAALQEIEAVSPFEHDALEVAFRALAERLELKTGIVFGAIRVAITGRTAAPPLFDTMMVLGRERVRDRLQAALQNLERWQQEVASAPSVTV